MLNVNEFKAAMVRRGKTQEQVAKEVGMSPKTLGNKMKKGVFNSNEIEKLIAVLKIENPMAIFFG